MGKRKRPLEAEDFGTNRSQNPYFGEILGARLSRREAVLGGLGSFALTMFGPGCGDPEEFAASEARAALRARSKLNFSSVGGRPMIAGDELWLPAGYQYKALLKCGDPIGSLHGAPPFRSTAEARAANTGAEAELQFGDNHDGLEFFPFPFASIWTRAGLLATNHESARAAVISGFRFQRSPDPALDTQHDPDAVQKQKASHGVSVAEVYRDRGGEWQVQLNSKYAFKVHADSPIEITGPARGHPAMRTSYDPEGVLVRGTLGNCGSGMTPWGTYLTCEEDSHKNYFYTGDWASDDPRKSQPRWLRYGISGGNERDYTWHFLDPRFHVNLEPNEPNRFGWVVEIDPYDPLARPKKRTALGRFAHENCAFLLHRSKRVAIYMGDDQGFDYIYKFVTSRAMTEVRGEDERARSEQRRLNRDLLDEGTLYVAKFHDDGSGEWLPMGYGANGLTPENGFDNQGDVVIWARLAADRLGATQMDRPEWLASDPHTGWVYATLSNNTGRGQTAPLADGRTPEPTNAANPRANNVHGQIIRLRDERADVTATRFRWELVVLAGSSESPNENTQGSVFGDAFSSPDGVTFDQFGRLWISTDAADKLTFANQTGDDSDWAGLGNDMLLAMDASTGEVKRFLVAPNGAEVCGVVLAPDGRSLFVNIQHPGTEQPRWNPDGTAANEPATLTWPDKIPVAQGGIQRSCTVVITRQDGGLIGF